MFSIVNKNIQHIQSTLYALEEEKQMLRVENMYWRNLFVDQQCEGKSFSEDKKRKIRECFAQVPTPLTRITRDKKLKEILDAVRHEK